MSALPISATTLPETIRFTDEKTKSEFQARLDITHHGATIFCNFYRGNSEIIGSMTLNVNKRGICIIGLQNFTENQVKHVGQEMVRIAEKIKEIKQIKGALSTYATKSSHLFFHKMGFTPYGFEGDKNKKLILEELAKCSEAQKRHDTSHLPSMLMRLVEPQ